MAYYGKLVDNDPDHPLAEAITAIQRHNTRGGVGDAVAPVFAARVVLAYLRAAEIAPDHVIQLEEGLEADMVVYREAFQRDLREWD